MEQGERIGAWVLERLLGEGAMGEVWRAHKASDPTVVAAFKRIKGEITSERARRFLREAAILADLDHPGVPAFLGYSTHPAFLAMEYVEGRSIGELLAERGSFSVADSLEVTRQVVDAIAYIHAREIWHRDIKPDNLILTRDGWIKLVDFGVARGEGYADLTAAGMVVGTVSYMPPEAFREQEITPVAWDLYGAGVLLHRLLTGRNGFETAYTGKRGQTDQARRKLSEPHLDPGDAFPEPVRELVRALTAQDPAQRITSAGTAGRRLQEVLRDHAGADLRAVIAEIPAAPDASADPRRSDGPTLMIVIVVAATAVVLLLLVAVLLAFLAGLVGVLIAL